MAAYYNENDPAAAHVLRHLIAENVIAPGDVDDRSIKEVHPNDVEGYTQCHWFAGGGLWSVAARMAGWPDDRPLWTASCPCQPFSAAGKRAGTDDPRHLWPDLYRILRVRRPVVVVGEQVAGKAGYDWFDGVSADLEKETYASRAVDFPSCSIDTPHQRNREFWIALADYESGKRWSGLRQVEAQQDRHIIADRNGNGPLASCKSEHRRRQQQERQAQGRTLVGRPVAGERLSPDADQPQFQEQPSTGQQPVYEPDAPELRRNGSYWSDAKWIECHDGKTRRTKPGIRFLVDGLPGRVDLWRIGGNAIVPQAAAEVIGALMDLDEL